MREYIPLSSLWHSKASRVNAAELKIQRKSYKRTLFLTEILYKRNFTKRLTKIRILMMVFTEIGQSLPERHVFPDVN